MADPKEAAARTFTESVIRKQILDYESFLTCTLCLFTLEHLQARYHYNQPSKKSTQKPAPDHKIRFTELAGLLQSFLGSMRRDLGSLKKETNVLK